MGKDCKGCKSDKIGHSSHSKPLQWEKIEKVANQLESAILSHSEPLWWEKSGKVVSQMKLDVLSHSEPLRLEKLEKL